MSFARRVSPGQSDASVEQPWPRIARDRNRAVPEERDEYKQPAAGGEQKASRLTLRQQGVRWSIVPFWILRRP